MQKQFLFSAAALAITVALSGPVSAADLRAPIYKAPPIQVPAFNWSGFYIGADVGYGSAPFGFNTGINSGRYGSIVGGGHLGYNWQAGMIVWGLEGDVSGANFKAGQTNPIFAEVDLLASVRGRLGLAFDRVLVYGTGGVGYISGKGNAQTFGTIIPVTFNKSMGVIGVGVEWAFANNFTARVETLDYLGNNSFNIGGDLNNTVGNIWVTRVGLGYKF